MTIESLVLGCIAVLVPVGLGVLTGIGSLHRGAPPAVRVVSAALFPVTWVVWYVRDDLLGTRAHERVPRGPRPSSRR